MLSALEHLTDLVDILRTRNPVLVCDIDGTLSPIVDDPEQAKVTPRAREALEKLARRLAVVAVVTGRPVHDAKRMVGLNNVLYFGNHGMERLERGQARMDMGAKVVAAHIAQLIPKLKPKLEPAGVRFEDKGVGLSLHYRAAGDPRAAHASIVSVLKEIGLPPELEARGGKMVVELRPRNGPNKGQVVRRLAAEYRAGGMIFLGDDLTDVDAFTMLREIDGCRTASVAVLTPETPEAVRQADYFVDGVDGIERLLEGIGEGLAATRAS